MKHPLYQSWISAHETCKACHWEGKPDDKPACVCGPQPCPRCGDTAADNIYSYDACDKCVPQAFTDFHEAYNWLEGHPAFFTPRPVTSNGEDFSLEGFTRSLEIAVCLVDPETGDISEDTSKNTQTQVFLQVGVWVKPDLGKEDRQVFHRYGSGSDSIRRPDRDFDLASQGSTYEEAIVKLANKVLDKYGEYRFESEALCPGV